MVITVNVILSLENSHKNKAKLKQIERFGDVFLKKTGYEDAVKCTPQMSAQNTAQSFGQFGQFGQMIKCLFRNKVVVGSNHIAVS